MTATTFGTTRREAVVAERRFPLAPAEGWTTLGLVLLLCLTLAWSIDDAAWVIGPRGLTGFLPWTIALGVAWGFLSAKVGWSRWLAHLLGAIFAALLVSMIVGSRLVAGGGPVDWFQATAASCVDAWIDLTYLNLPFTRQIGHFLLVLGLLAWATGQYAGYVTFHHRRPLNAVIIIGIGLVANMSLTLRDQLPYLVVYSLAALFLLIRFHAYDESVVWLRHRIGDAATLGGLYLRGGTVFVGSAVVIALILTSTASSNPLAPMWKGVDQKLIEFGREFQRVFRGSGQGTRLNAVDFSGSALITGSWTTDNSPVMTITVPDDGRYYWRAVTYDRFDGQAWSWSKPADSSIPAGSPLLGQSADDPTDLQARHQVTFTVHEQDFDPRSVFAPDTPIAIDVDAQLTTVTSPTDSPAWFAGLNADGGDYKVTASVFIDFADDPDKGLTANRLRVAGTDYPPSVKALYTTYDRSLVGPDTEKLMTSILTRHPRAKDSAYDMARAITDYLVYEGGFRYEADVRDVKCGDRKVVECFAWSKMGYCEYYASTMAILLRMNGIPARLADGFLPGSRNPAGVEQILQERLPRLGRGLLPWLRLGSVRPDRRPGRPRCAAATRTHRVRGPGNPAPVAAGGPRRPASEHPGDPGRRSGRDDHRSGRVGWRHAHRRRCVAGRDHGRSGLHRLAARTAQRVGAGRGLAERRRAGPPPGLRAATQPDRVRVHDVARRGPAERPTGSPHGRPGEGRGGVRPGHPGRRSAALAARRPAAAAGRPARLDLPAQGAARAPGSPALRTDART